VDPRFSPDGKKLSFIRAYHRAHQELFTVDLAGGQPRQITTDIKQVSGAGWLPDSQTLVFASNRDGGFRLWKVQPGAAKREATFQSTSVYGDFPIQMSLARDAPVLVYSVLQYDFNIWRLDLRARKPDARWARIIASSAQDASPQYSPDGQRICFRSDRSGEEQLWVTRADGSNAVQVTSGVNRPSVGRWSPDGRSIVFNSALGGGLFVASENGGRWAVRGMETMAVHPVFSADGRYIYGGTNSSIVRIPAAGGPAVEIVNVKALSLGLAPDGKSIYFVREPADTNLWRLSLDTLQVTKVLAGLVPYCTSCWAADANGIYFLGPKPHTWSRQTIYFHELHSGQERPVLEYPEPLSPIGSGPFSLSPDGRYLLCVRVDPSNADIMRVEPFR
jgi:Tol biopolymer transport system component